MTDEASEMSEHSHRLNTVVGAFLEAEQAGRPFDRQGLVAAHPALAADLEEFFADYDRLQHLARPLRAVASGGREHPDHPQPSPVRDELARVPMDAGEPTEPFPAREPQASDASIRESETHGIRGLADTSLTSSQGNGEGANTKDRPSIHYFGDYELMGVLGEGGMGVVYRARQISLNRLVAVKMIRAGLWASDAEVRRFWNEAESVANLDHPNIVPIHEVSQHAGQHYFSMKLVEGCDLAQRLHDYVADPRSAAQLLSRISHAMHHAHQRGILHRDLKPSNVLLDREGRPHLTDFGLAKRIDGHAEISHSGTVAGTPTYMAPEQAAGHRGAITTATDVYGLGAILYATLTGRPPFRGDSVLELLQLVSEVAPSRPSSLNRRVDRDLETICLKCLEKDPGRRYASVDALAEDLERWLAGEPIAARRIGPVERAVKWARRRPVITALLALVALVAVLGFAGVTWQARRAELARQAEAQAKVQAVGEKGRAEQARAQAEAALYRSLIALADAKASGYEVGRAEQILDDAPRALRGWEWHYLKRRFQTSLLTIDGHKGPANGVVFSPDGSRLASWGDDQVVRVWDAANGRLTLTLAETGNGVFGAAFSPDGRRIAMGGSQSLPDGGSRGAVRIFDAATGRCLRTMPMDGYVLGACFSPDGHVVASFGFGKQMTGPGVVMLWDSTTFKEIRCLQAHSEGIQSVAFSPRGDRLASAGGDRTVKIWDVMTGDKLLDVPTGASHVTFSRDGTRLALAGGYGVRVLEATTGKELLSLANDGGGTEGVALSLDGSHIATAHMDRTVRIWDGLTGREVHRLHGHTSLVFSVRYSPDGSRVASASADGTVKVWATTQSHDMLTLRAHTGGAWGVLFSRDGHRIATYGADRKVRIWDASSGAERLALEASNGVQGLAFSDDGSRLVTAEFQGAPVAKGFVKIWDLKSGKETRCATLAQQESDFPITLALSLDGLQFVSVNAGTVRVHDTATGRELLRFGSPERMLFRYSVFSADGRRIAVFGNNRMTGEEFFVTIRDAVTGQEIRQIGGPYSMSFSPDGRLLAGIVPNANARECKIWDIETGSVIQTFHGATSNPTFSPDGRRLISGGPYEALTLWDTSSGREILTLHGHEWGVTGVAFSPDGTRIAAAGQDGTVRVYDRRPLREMPGDAPLRSSP